MSGEPVDPALPRRERIAARGRVAAAAGVLLRDVILGGQDGLVNVLGLVLGLAAATGDARVILTAGLAAMMAESIAMAGVAFTAGGAERDWVRARTSEVSTETEMRADALLGDALERVPATDPVIAAEMRRAVESAVLAERSLRRSQYERLRDELAPVRERHPVAAAALVGISTLVGSAIPLVPFVVLPAGAAPPVALVLGALTLFAAGVVRARVAGLDPLRAGLTMTAIGIASAAAGYTIGVLLRAPAGV